MDFQISTAGFIRFLERCRTGKLVKDLIIQATSDMICAKFTDSNKLVYGEVYEKATKIAETGKVKVPSVEKLIACLKRSDVQMVRLKSVEGVFMVVDGGKVGNLNVKFTEIKDEESVESYVRIENSNIKFDHEKLDYLNGKIMYKNGFVVPTESLQTIVKDSKAFGMEFYNFKINKDGILVCEIEDKSTKDRFTRLVPTIEKIGGDFQPCSVGMGMKEIVSAIEDGFTTEKKEDPRRNVKIYFEEKSILLTDGVSYYYNFHTL